MEQARAQGSTRGRKVRWGVRRVWGGDMGMEMSNQAGWAWSLGLELGLLACCVVFLSVACGVVLHVIDWHEEGQVLVGKRHANGHFVRGHIAAQGSRQTRSISVFQRLLSSCSCYSWPWLFQKATLSQSLIIVRP